MCGGAAWKGAYLKYATAHHAKLFGVPGHALCNASLHHCIPLDIQALYYLLGTRPNAFLGLLDFYLLGPVAKGFRQNFKASDFALRDK